MSRWLIEPSTGVFVGSPSARIRDELWKKVLDTAPEGTALQMWSAQNPQGFAYRQHNTAQRELVIIDGLTLVRTFRKDTLEKEQTGLLHSRAGDPDTREN